MSCVIGNEFATLRIGENFGSIRSYLVCVCQVCTMRDEAYKALLEHTAGDSSPMQVSAALSCCIRRGCMVYDITRPVVKAESNAV